MIDTTRYEEQQMQTLAFHQRVTWRGYLKNIFSLRNNNNKNKPTLQNLINDNTK